MMNEKYSIFNIEGGLGKHVAATAVARCIKKNHPDRELIVVCSYPEIFINLDFVSRVYKHGNTPYFYQDFIKDQDFLMFKHEPYYTTDHIKKSKPLIENWCNLYNLDYSGELPELVLNYRQHQYSNNIWNSDDKPIFVIQTHGGPLEKQQYNYSWTRDMPPYLWDSVISKFQDTHRIIQICRNKSQAINHPSVVPFYNQVSNIDIAGLIEYSDKRLLIDSSLQHIAAALNKKSTVLWIGTDPFVFGYKKHYNIIAKLGDNNFKLPDSYLFDYNFAGVLHECPVLDQSSMFDVSEIISSFS